MTTRMLAIVANEADAEAAIAGGVDRLVVRSAHPGLDAAATQARVAAIGAVARGRCPVSLWWGPGGLPVSAAVSFCGADEVWEGGQEPSGSGLPRWIVVAPGESAAPERAGGGCIGIVVDAGDAARLLERVAIHDFEAQARQARALGLGFGICAALEAPDVPRLTAIGPDRLVFGDILRQDGAAGAALAPERIGLMRALVRGELRPSASFATNEPDRIFVRDWTLPVHLGAYGHEHAAQRVRFTVEAEVARTAERATDMRDVVTYDLITDAIARATVAHVALVETIAEDVAALILAHPRVVGVDVTVEKLDLGPGSLGCRIRRRRAA